MDHIVAKKLDVFATVYLDSIMVFSHTKQDHAKHLWWVLEKLRKDSLKTKKKKVHLDWMNSNTWAIS